VAFGLLIGAKVLNVCVPYLFKIGVDSLGPVADFTSTVDTVSSFSLAVLLGCKLGFAC
jgi:ATP-binding cassette subfamily B (MDR/TAP) protein 7